MAAHSQCLSQAVNLLPCCHQDDDGAATIYWLEAGVPVAAKGNLHRAVPVAIGCYGHPCLELVTGSRPAIVPLGSLSSHDEAMFSSTASWQAGMHSNHRLAALNSHLTKHAPCSRIHRRASQTKTLQARPTFSPSKCASNSCACRSQAVNGHVSRLTTMMSFVDCSHALHHACSGMSVTLSG